MLSGAVSQRLYNAGRARPVTRRPVPLDDLCCHRKGSMVVPAYAGSTPDLRGAHLMHHPSGPSSFPSWGRRVLATVALPALLVACSSDSTDAASDRQPSSTSTTTSGTTTTEFETGVEPTWPGSEWEVVSPEAAGLDPEALETMAAAAEAGGSECLVVTKDGRIVGEWYWQGFDQDREREVFSVTKSITSTLVGIAQDRGLLDIDQPASDFITEWQGTPSEAVTLRNLLANDSGRFQTAESDYGVLPGEPDQTGYAIGLEQQHEPGTEWVYNNAAIQTLDRVIEEATGMPTHEFAHEALFEPLGMDTEISQDATGNTRTFMGAQASCRDLARFGHLFAEEGKWSGEQVLSPAFVEEATSPSQELNPGYGFLWWLNRPGTVGEGSGEGDASRLAPSGPDDMFAAQGLFGQYVDVFPSSGMVVTRLGQAEGEGGAQFGNDDVAVGVRDALAGG